MPHAHTDAETVTGTHRVQMIWCGMPSSIVTRTVTPATGSQYRAWRGDEECGGGSGSSHDERDERGTVPEQPPPDRGNGDDAKGFLRAEYLDGIGCSPLRWRPGRGAPRGGRGHTACASPLPDSGSSCSPTSTTSPPYRPRAATENRTPPPRIVFPSPTRAGELRHARAALGIRRSESLPPARCGRPPYPSFQGLLDHLATLTRHELRFPRHARRRPRPHRAHQPPARGLRPHRSPHLPHPAEVARTRRHARRESAGQRRSPRPRDLDTRNTSQQARCRSR
jgi:hypothetical protein